MLRKLFVLYGGSGREREVSISSAKNVMEVLEGGGIRYESIFVNQNGTWTYKGKELSKDEGVSILKAGNALVFQVIHGTYGEDGELTAILEENNISYVGSSSEAMKLTIDKYETEKILRSKNISATESVLVSSVSDIENIKVNFPAFVKPKNEGSSVALFKVKSEQELRGVLEKTIPVYGVMLVQSFVSGREFTCGVVEMGGITQALLPTEIILTKGETFDYEAKYTVGGSKEVTPAAIDDELTKKIQDLALRVHEVCGCKDISRTDMILRDDGEIVVLEINTIPGMTKTSFIPAQLEASGYSIMDFVGGMTNKYS